MHHIADRNAATLREEEINLLVEAGIDAESGIVPEHLSLFAEQACKVLSNAGPEYRDDFHKLLVKVVQTIMSHPIIADNRYLKRFGEGVTFRQARHELQQFSVFAIHFDVAAARLVANAPTQEAYQERLKILLNEKGIPFKNGFDGELTGRWSPKTVHFNWLQKMAAGLDLKFEEIGKIWIGLPGTVQFVDTVMETYAAIDQNIACGASLAIENWAANALWAPWISGMKKLNANLVKKVPIGYLTYHLAEETYHSRSTLDELLCNFREPWFDEERFLLGARTVLDEGVQTYYESQLAALPEKEGNRWPA